MDNSQLEEDINKRNFSNYNEGCTVVHSYVNTNKGTQTALIEVSADIYKIIRENNNKIFVGHQKCISYDIIDVKPCLNCGIFGHKAKKCCKSAHA